MAQRILIIDGLNMFLRTFCKVPAMDNNGNPIGGIVGSLRSIKSIMRDVRPSRVIVTWDGKGGSSKRRAIYNEYKAGRKPRLNRELDESVDESRTNMQVQYGKLREYLSLIGVTQIEVEGCEADDIIGYLVTGPYEEEQKVIVSTDRDFLQLVNGRTIVYSPTLKNFYTKKNFLELTEVIPENFIYFKALSGDGSDNLPGIKGLGPKTILKFFPFLAERKTDLDEIKVHAEGFAPNGKKEKAVLEALLAGWDVIKANLHLMDLRTTIISPSSTRAIKYALREDCFMFKFTDLKLALIRNGIQTLDQDFFTVFTDYKHAFERETAENAG